MPWLIPSYGRPGAPRQMCDAPGGMPDDVAVLVNEDDPALPRYKANNPSTWRLIVVPAGSRFCDAVRHAYDHWDGNAPLYWGICDDDYWPITPGWYDKMIEAAGGTGVAIANNRQNFPKPYTCRLMGGALARAIGTIAPGKMRHNYSDDTWARIAEDFKLYHPLEDVIVEHRHHLFDPSVRKDATYERGSGDFGNDRALYAEWLNSDERREQYKRVAELLGVSIATRDLSNVHLAICTPMQTMQVDWRFFESYFGTTLELMQRGVKFTPFQSFGGSHIGKAREHVLWRAMANPDVTHFLFIDDDMGWDPHLPIRLMMADHDFCAAVGVRKVEGIATEDKFCFNPMAGGKSRVHPVTKFVEVRDVGFAFVMLKRNAIERMCLAYPELRHNTGDQPARWALFLDMIDKTATERGEFGERLSEDFSFCRRWRAIGGEIWIDPAANLIHAGRKEFSGAPTETMSPIKEAAA